jgi:glycosyltransferase involved in cell wall biosynthesis
LPIVTTTSGAIPEVAGDSAEYVAPGDWIGLAETLARGVLTRPPGQRVAHAPDRVARFSIEAAAERLAAIYDEVMELPPGRPAPGSRAE